MGAIFPVLDKEVEGTDVSSVSGKLINRFEPELSKVAEDSGVASIMSFFGANPYEYFDEDEFEELKLSEKDFGEKWFEPKDGLQVFEFLIEHLRKNKSMFGNETDDVISDLEDFRKVLEKAQEFDAKWHIEIEI